MPFFDAAETHVLPVAHVGTEQFVGPERDILICDRLRGGEQLIPQPAFDASLRRLQLDHVDCYLIHTFFALRPGDEQDPKDNLGQVKYDRGVTSIETWRALDHLVDDGQCKAIGLSDVNLAKLREVVAAARIKPAVVQVEAHPYLLEWDRLDFCREHGIILFALSTRRQLKSRSLGPCNAAPPS